MGISPAIINSSIGTHHVCIPANFLWPEIIEIFILALSPFCFSIIEALNIILIRSFEITSIIIVTLCLTFRTMALQSIERHRSSMFCRTDRFQRIIFLATLTAGKMSLTGDRAFQLDHLSMIKESVWLFFCAYLNQREIFQTFLIPALGDLHICTGISAIFLPICIGTGNAFYPFRRDQQPELNLFLLDLKCFFLSIRGFAGGMFPQHLLHKLSGKRMAVRAFQSGFIPCDCSQFGPAIDGVLS